MHSLGQTSGRRSTPFVFSNADMTFEQAHAVWSTLRKGITEIQNGNASHLRYEELYRNAYTLVLHKHGNLLYDGVVQTIGEKLEDVAVAVEAASDETVLNVVTTQWTTHKLVMTMIRDVLMYMDKTFCVSESKTLIYDVGVTQFKKKIIQRGSVQTKIQNALLRNIHAERCNNIIARDEMKNASNMLCESNLGNIDLYQSVFEDEFLAQTIAFYHREAQDFIANNTCADFLRMAEKRLGEEEGRADAYMLAPTKSKLSNIVHKELIIQYAPIIVNNSCTGFVSMLSTSSIDDLRRMYSLFARVSSLLDLMMQSMQQRVREKGEAIVNDRENKKSPKKFVQCVLDLRTKYFMLVQQAFDGNYSFARSLKIAFEHFINLDSRAAHYLSLYIDEMMKKGLRGVAPDEIESKLDHIVTIFRYLNDKDVFEDFYKQHLASRLLIGQRVSDDVEKTMIAKLKAECGHHFTSKLEGMFKNMTLSKELNDEFQQWKEPITETLKTNQEHIEAELFVSVLTSGFWPFPEISVCHLPPAIQPISKKFEKFYSSRHSGHKLMWQTSLGSAELVASFAAGKKELIVHTYQMCILLLYNDGNDSYRYEEIQKLTKIPESELQRYLLSLAHPKVKVLIKHPNTKKIESNHTFTYNSSYSNCLRRVKIPVLAAPCAQSEQQSQVPSAVIETRKNRVEASIVRIMKSRRTLDHNNLIAEVCKQLSTRFAAQPSFIKRRIESLIEKDYLKRDQADRRVYHYLA